MDHYDIVFVGQMGMGKVVPFEGSPYIERASPVFSASIAASCLGKKIAAVTRVSESEKYLLEPLKSCRC